MISIWRVRKEWSCVKGRNPTKKTLIVTLVKVFKKTPRQIDHLFGLVEEGWEIKGCEGQMVIGWMGNGNPLERGKKAGAGKMASWGHNDGKKHKAAPSAGKGQPVSPKWGKWLLCGIQKMENLVSFRRKRLSIMKRYWLLLSAVGVTGGLNEISRCGKIQSFLNKIPRPLPWI